LIPPTNWDATLPCELEWIDTGALLSDSAEVERTKAAVYSKAGKHLETDNIIFNSSKEMKTICGDRMISKPDVLDVLDEVVLPLVAECSYANAASSFSFRVAWVNFLVLVPGTAALRTEYQRHHTVYGGTVC
jgi:hypothetical protein